jgi:hypothetical protein
MPHDAHDPILDAMLDAVRNVRSAGNTKYGPALRTLPECEWIGAAMGHIARHLRGEVRDPESGLPHLHLAAVRLLCVDQRP